MIDRGGAPRGHRLTPAEIHELGYVRGRSCLAHDEPQHRCTADASDTAPMVRVTYRAVPTNGRAGAAFATSREVIPWLEALNLEPED